MINRSYTYQHTAAGNIFHDTPVPLYPQIVRAISCDFILSKFNNDIVKIASRKYDGY